MKKLSDGLSVDGHICDVADAKTERAGRTTLITNDVALDIGSVAHEVSLAHKLGISVLTNKDLFTFGSENRFGV